MQQPDKIAEYLKTVSQQIRWKKAQPVILEEIEGHLTDQRNAYLRDGFAEETATDKAIAEMGDPVVVGEQLDRAHRPRPDWTLLALTGTMLILGIVLQTFVNSAVEGEWLLERQVIWAGIAFIVMTAAYFADFTVIGKYPKIVFSILWAVTILFSFFTEEINGRASNMTYPLLLFPTAFAGFTYSMRNKGYFGLMLCGAAFLVPAYLSLIMPSITTLFILSVSCLIILTAAVLKGWFGTKRLPAMLIIYIPTAVVLSIPFIISIGTGYRAMRLKTLLNPSSDPMGAGFMVSLINQILSHSRFIGGGSPLEVFGVSEITQILPEINTDFMLTYLTHRFGWIVLIGIIVLFSAFIFRAAVLCKKQKSVLGFLTSTAIVSTFAMQSIVYIASNLGFLLFSPLSLPLISSGWKYIITNMLLIGFMLSVFRTGTLVKDKADAALVNTKRFIKYNNGQIIINLKSNLHMKMRI